MIVQFLFGSEARDFFSCRMIFGIWQLAVVQAQALIYVSFADSFNELLRVLRVQCLLFEFFVDVFVRVLAEGRGITFFFLDYLFF